MTETTAAASGRSLLAYGLGKIIPGLLLFMAVPLWTRIFGPEQYGFYSIAWSVALFSSSLFTGWIRQALLRHTGNEGATLRSLPRWTIPAASVLSSVPVALLVAVQLRHVGDGRTFIISAILFTVINSAYTVLQASAQRQARSTTYTLAEIVRVGGAVLASLAVQKLLGLEGGTSILIGFCLSSISAVGVLQWRQIAKSKLHSYRPERTRGDSTLATFWRYGWPMAIWLAASTLLLYQDRVIIGSILGPAAAGEYAAVADLIVRGFAMVSFPLTMVSHPLIMGAWNRGEASSALVINRTFKRYLIGLSVVIVLSGCLFGQSVLELILDIRITEPLLVPLLLIGAALWQLGLMTHKELEVENRTRLMAILIVSVATSSAVINAFLTAQSGIVGPAAVFAAGAGAYVLITYSLGARLRKRSIHV